MSTDLVRLKYLASFNPQAVPETTPPDAVIDYVDFAAADLVSGTVEAKSMTFSHAPSRARRKVRAGDSLVPTLVRPSDTHLPSLLASAAHEPLVFSTGFLVVRPNSARVNPRFLSYALRSATVGEHLVRHATGVTMIAFSMEAAATARVPAPDLADQGRIATYLDEQVRRLDQAGALRRQQIWLLGERRSAALAKVFAVDAPSLPLRRVVARWIDYRGATPTKTTAGIPLVTAKNIRHGVINLSTSEEFIAEADYDAWMRRGLPVAGDVLLTTEAPLGEVAQVADPGVALAQRVILLRADEARLHPRWLYWFLRSPQGQDELWSRATGTTAQGIKAERLREVRMPLPPLAEQVHLLTEVEEAEHEWRRVTPMMTRSLDLLAEHKRALIDAAVTGDLDVATARRVAVA